MRLHPVVPLQELLLRNVPRRGQRLQTLEEAAVVVVPGEGADRIPGRKGGCDSGGDEGGGEQEVLFSCHGVSDVKLNSLAMKGYRIVEDGCCPVQSFKPGARHVGDRRCNVTRSVTVLHPARR